MDGMGILFGKHGFPMVTFCILFLVGKHMHVSSKKTFQCFREGTVFAGTKTKTVNGLKGTFVGWIDYDWFV